MSPCTPVSLRRRVAFAAALVIAVGASAIPASAAPPSNDDVANATVIDALPFTVQADTTEATRSPDDPGCGLFRTGPSVWYVFTAPKDIRLWATANLGYVIAVSGTPGAWTPRGCGDDEKVGLRLSVVAGETVYLMIANRRGIPGAQGTLSVQRVRKPPNDDFDDASSIAQLPFHATVDLDLATSADDDPGCFGQQHRTVWYTYTPSGEELLDISVDYPYPDFGFGTTNMTVSAYVGTRGSLDRIACGSSDAQSLTGSRIGIRDATAGEPIYLMVGLDRAVAAGFPVDLRVVRGHVPSNDRLRDAKEIVELPYRDDADSFWASPVGDPASAPGCDRSRHSIWYSFTTPSDMRLRVTVQGPAKNSGDGVTMVYADPRASPTLLSCSVAREQTGSQSVEVNLRADQTVYLLADGFGGLLTFRVQAVPVDTAPNDALADATHVGQRRLPFSRTVNVRPATSGRHDPDCLGAHHTVWYRFTPRYTMRAEVSTAGSAYDTALAAFESIDDELAFIACRDDDLEPDPVS